jgi:hypothetical protein
LTASHDHFAFSDLARLSFSFSIVEQNSAFSSSIGDWLPYSSANVIKRPISKRINFSSEPKAVLARRSAFECAICKAPTFGPSMESTESVTCVGVAAHITAASPGGPRYDAELSPKQRCSAENGIWLCQNHAKMIDDDEVKWTVSELRAIKLAHERDVYTRIGVPPPTATHSKENVSAPCEFAFAFVRELIPAYRAILEPMLRFHELKGNSELGLLMCGEPPEQSSKKNRQTPWTVFVKAEWLRWILSGQSAGFPLAQRIPSEQIYGQIPGWPDTFLEFLQAMVQTNTTFQWRRSAKGFLILAQ